MGGSSQTPSRVCFELSPGAKGRCCAREFSSPTNNNHPVVVNNCTVSDNGFLALLLLLLAWLKRRVLGLSTLQYITNFVTQDRKGVSELGADEIKKASAYQVRIL